MEKFEPGGTSWEERSTGCWGKNQASFWGQLCGRKKEAGLSNRAIVPKSVCKHIQINVLLCRWSVEKFEEHVKHIVPKESAVLPAPPRACHPIPLAKSCPAASSSLRDPKLKQGEPFKRLLATLRLKGRFREREQRFSKSLRSLRTNAKISA